MRFVAIALRLLLLLLILLQFRYRLGYLAGPLTTDYSHRFIVHLRLNQLRDAVAIATIAAAAATVILL